MWIFNFLKKHHFFKFLVSLSAVILICSFSIRSLIVKPSANIHKIYSILSHTNTQPQLELDESQDDSSDCSPIPINQRPRSEAHTDNTLLITAVQLTESFIYDPTNCQRLEISYSSLSLRSASIGPIERPPKSIFHTV
jgi:hypothetical protein